RHHDTAARRGLALARAPRSRSIEPNDLPLASHAPCGEAARVRMGGTGLEPVTPSLSRRPPRSRLFARASAFSFPCRDFTLQRQAAFVPVCTLSRGLVVAPSAVDQRQLRTTRNAQTCALTLDQSYVLHELETRSHPRL